MFHVDTLATSSQLHTALLKPSESYKMLGFWMNLEENWKRQEEMLDTKITKVTNFLIKWKAGLKSPCSHYAVDLPRHSGGLGLHKLTTLYTAQRLTAATPRAAWWSCIA